MEPLQRLSNAESQMKSCQALCSSPESPKRLALGLWLATNVLLKEGLLLEKTPEKTPWPSWAWLAFSPNPTAVWIFRHIQRFGLLPEATLQTLGSLAKRIPSEPGSPSPTEGLERFAQLDNANRRKDEGALSGCSLAQRHKDVSAAFHSLWSLDHEAETHIEHLRHTSASLRELGYCRGCVRAGLSLVGSVKDELWLSAVSQVAEKIFCESTDAKPAKPASPSYSEKLLLEFGGFEKTSTDGTAREEPGALAGALEKNRWLKRSEWSDQQHGSDAGSNSEVKPIERLRAIPMFIVSRCASMSRQCMPTLAKTFSVADSANLIEPDIEGMWQMKVFEGACMFDVPDLNMLNTGLLAMQQARIERYENGEQFQAQTVLEGKVEDSAQEQGVLQGLQLMLKLDNIRSQASLHLLIARGHRSISKATASIKQAQRRQHAMRAVLHGKCAIALHSCAFVQSVAPFVRHKSSKVTGARIRSSVSSLFSIALGSLSTAGIISGESNFSSLLFDPPSQDADLGSLPAEALVLLHRTIGACFVLFLMRKASDLGDFHAAAAVLLLWVACDQLSANQSRQQSCTDEQNSGEQCDWAKMSGEIRRQMFKVCGKEKGCLFVHTSQKLRSLWVLVRRLLFHHCAVDAVDACAVLPSFTDSKAATSNNSLLRSSIGLKLFLNLGELADCALNANDPGRGGWAELHTLGKKAWLAWLGFAPGQIPGSSSEKLVEQFRSEHSRLQQQLEAAQEADEQKLRAQEACQRSEFLMEAAISAGLD